MPDLIPIQPNYIFDFTLLKSSNSTGVVKKQKFNTIKQPLLNPSNFKQSNAFAFADPDSLINSRVNFEMINLKGKTE